jgi:hypothetical protein
MFGQLGLNISDVASFYTRNITIVRKVYDTDSMASPTATFPDSVLISFTLDTEEKVSYVTLRGATWSFVLFFLLKPLPVRISFWCRS